MISFSTNLASGDAKQIVISQLVVQLCLAAIDPYDLLKVDLA